MKKISSAAGLALVVMLTITGQAFAWSSKPTHISCGQADFTLSRQATPWKYVVTQDDKVVDQGTFTNPTESVVTIGVRATDGLPHEMWVYVASVANPRDGANGIGGLFVNCGPTKGTPGPGGPAGPKGDPGTPGLNGINGRDGKDAVSTQTTKTIIERVAPKRCTSRRVYTFKVRKRYQSKPVGGPITALDKGAKITVRSSKGRYVVTADYRGLKPGAFTHQRHILVTAVVGGERLRFNENVDLCRPETGAQNAPSASGNAKG